MAKIFEKSVTDKTLILEPREGLLRKFDFGNDWTEVRVGMFFSIVTAAGDDTYSGTLESLAFNTAADYVTFGLKNTSDEALPGLADSLFLGYMQPSGLGAQFSSGNIQNASNNQMSSGGFVGTTGVINAGTASRHLPCPTLAGTSADYAHGAMLKFVIADRGLATQTVTVTFGWTQTTGTDYSASLLRTEMNNATYNGLGSALAWNDTSDAYDIPDGFWVRLPFYDYRLRISAIRAIRYV
jgi:hypothetical protein